LIFQKLTIKIKLIVTSPRYYPRPLSPRRISPPCHYPCMSSNRSWIRKQFLLYKCWWK